MGFHALETRPDEALYRSMISIIHVSMGRWSTVKSRSQSNTKLSDYAEKIIPYAFRERAKTIHSLVRGFNPYRGERKAVSSFR